MEALPQSARRSILALYRLGQGRQEVCDGKSSRLGPDMSAWRLGSRGLPSGRGPRRLPEPGAFAGTDYALFRRIDIFGLPSVVTQRSSWATRQMPIYCGFRIHSSRAP